MQNINILNIAASKSTNIPKHYTQYKLPSLPLSFVKDASREVDTWILKQTHQKATYTCRATNSNLLTRQKTTYTYQQVTQNLIFLPKHHYQRSQKLGAGLHDKEYLDRLYSSLGEISGVLSGVDYIRIYQTSLGVTKIGQHGEKCLRYKL